MDDRLKKALNKKFNNHFIPGIPMALFVWIQTVYIYVMGGDSCSSCSGGPKNQINLLDKTGLKSSKWVARRSRLIRN